jgi:hypothetical protein
MWNEQVDAFDVAGLVDQLASTGAKCLLFTIGQNSGHCCAPNATCDRIVGITPSKCSRRDLIFHGHLADSSQTANLYAAEIDRAFERPTHLGLFYDHASTRRPRWRGPRLAMRRRSSIPF